MQELEMYELTAYEVAALNEAAIDEYIRRPEFRSAESDSQVRQRMLETMIKEKGLRGGWVWTSPVSNEVIGGPFDSYADALIDARSMANWTIH